MFTDPITMRDAKITAVHLKMASGKLHARITVSSTLSTELAEALEAKSLVFRENGAPREGFNSLSLDTGCAAFSAVFEADPAMKQSFELTSGDSTDQYSVVRLDEGVLSLRLRLNYHGDVHRPLAYWQAIGDGDSKLVIKPLQTAIDDSDAPKKNRFYDDDDEEDEEQDENQEPLFEKPADAPEPARHQLIDSRRGRGRKTLHQ